ncbi:MAG: hypothetical protein FIB01_09850 [Gemmatimonadetes bacterium]|nr:hypothetical protein [Gemmatimonadota bacterium]
MKLRWSGLAALLVLLPAAAYGQRGIAGAAVSIPQVDAVMIDTFAPLLQLERESASGLDDRLAERGMSKGEFIAFKNAVMIAKLDAGNAARINGLATDDPTRAIRLANANIYKRNATRIDAALQGVNPDPGCSLCRAQAARTRRF